MVFWGNFRYFGDFKVFYVAYETSMLWSRIRHAYRSLSKHSKSQPRAVQSSRTFRTFKDTVWHGIQAIRPSIRSNGGLLGWMELLRDSIGIESHCFGRSEEPFERMALIRENAQYIRANGLVILKFDAETHWKARMHLHSVEWGTIRANHGPIRSNSPQTARFLFFANRTPRAFRDFYLFYSLAYKYPLVSE